VTDSRTELAVVTVLMDTTTASSTTWRTERAVGLGARRALDVMTAAGGLLATLPLFAAFAVLIKLTSKGPVIFRQERVGQDGELFTVLKFRTMRNGTHHEVRNDPDALQQYIANDFKLDPSDPRITSIGRFLRKTSLDELPQLINVLRGEMSIVGIRPLLADELALRSNYDQECYQLLQPGMTGLWQVEGRSQVAHDDRHELDRRYVETWSFWNDLKIILRTPAAVLRTDHAH
jgi:exopolysaccharide production protein ExoY